MFSKRYSTTFEFNTKTIRNLFAAKYARQLVIISLIICTLAAFFWLESRLPALNSKAMMGARTPISSIAFNVLLPINDDQAVYERIARSFVNWSYTNWKGMLFGLLFGAALLTLLRYLPESGASQNRFINAFKGMSGGIPLSVCVNCATPVAHSLYSAGTRLELALALLISSPTLNIIVLTLLFSLFPLHFVIAKLAGTLFLVLVIVPLLVRFNARQDKQKSSANDVLMDASGQLNGAPSRLFSFPGATSGINPLSITPALSWPRAALEVVTLLAANLVWILKIALPFMLAAGLLGAAVIEIVPLQQLQNLPVSLTSLIGVALLGTFLPVPIAFDVIFSAVLLASGVNAAFVMVFLFTLGAFSVYPFSMLWKNFSARLPLALFFSTAAIGVILGIAVSQYETYVNREIVNVYTRLSAPSVEMAPSMKSKSPARENPSRPVPPPVSWQLLQDNADYRLSYLEFNPAAPVAGAAFQRLEGAAFAIRPAHGHSAAHVLEPFNFVRGIASADFNNDGYSDFVTSDPEGVQLFRNTGNGKFIATRTLENYDLRGAVVVAFVDINNDGRQDIFVSRYARSNLLLINNGQAFRDTKIIELAAGDNLSMAAAFADIDQDGKLDIVLGNWSHGQERAFNPRYSQNFYLLNRGETFIKKSLPGVTGETLSLLLSDINADNRPDLFVANDRKEPDLYYYADSNGGFRLIKEQKNLFPLTPLNTMSIESADFNNDGYLDLFSVDMSFQEKSQRRYCDDIQADRDRAQCESVQTLNHIIADNDIDGCAQLTDPADNQACMTAILLRLASRQKNSALCEKISADQFLQKALCRKLTQPISAPQSFDEQDYLPQKQANRMLFGGADGAFSDVTNQLGVRESLWSWNAKAADLDNDGWQDIYVANGYGQGKSPYEIDANVFYHNIQGRHFEMQEQAFGLDDYLNTPSYTYIDIDNDGDLDIIATAINGPLRLYRNNQSGRHAIQFELRDARMNRFAIGSKIRIHLADGSQQLRELKLSGGFLSFDAPLAHFGLGQNTSITGLEVIWPDGEKMLMNEPLAADRRYRIERKVSAK